MFSASCLTTHNNLRKKHRDTPAMQWDKTIEASAQKYANYLASSGKFEHSKDRKYGENLYWTSGKYSDMCAHAIIRW